MRPHLKINFRIWLILALGIAWAGPQLSPELSPAEKALGEAVRAGDLAQVQAALDQGVNPNIILEGSFTPLWVAASDGNVEMVKLLLQGGADPNLIGPDHTSGSPLFQAAREGHSEVVGLLLEAGADPDAGAWRDGCEKGATPLMAGAQNPEIVQKLLAAGADPHLSDSANTWGAGALQYAVGNPESLRLLLEEITGPGIQLVGGSLGTYIPYTYNSYEDEPPTVDLVAMRVPPRWWRVGSLLVATWAGDSASAQMLLEAGAKPSFDVSHLASESDPTGLDPSMAAAGTVWDDEAAGRKILAKLGGSWDGDFWWQDNALTYALEAGRVEWAGDLVERGFDPAHRDILGRDLLVRALDELIPPRLADMRGDNLPQVNKPELAKFLIAQGLSPKPERLVGQPLWSNHLLAAVQDQDPELVTTLIQGGAELDSGSFDGKTPLIHAVQNQDLELVKALIQGGASLDSPDHSGKTALIYATQNRDLELARALLEAGAKPNRYDLEDKTALDYARELGNRELVELLERAKP